MESNRFLQWFAYLIFNFNFSLQSNTYYCYWFILLVQKAFGSPNISTQHLRPFVPTFRNPDKLFRRIAKTKYYRSVSLLVSRPSLSLASNVLFCLHFCTRTRRIASHRHYDDACATQIRLPYKFTSFCHLKSYTVISVAGISLANFIFTLFFHAFAQLLPCPLSSTPSLCDCLSIYGLLLSLWFI